jgi:chaperonin GroES
MDKIRPSHLCYYIEYWRYRLKSARQKKKQKPRKSVNLPHLLAVISGVLLSGAKKIILFSCSSLDRNRHTPHLWRKVVWHSIKQSARYEEQTTTSYIFGGYGMKFRPLHDRVLVQREESEEKTAGGIIIPDTAKEKPMQGKVISVGSGARDEQGKVTPLDVKEGDIILFGKWSGTEIKLDGTDYLIMKESDIMGIIG